MNAAFLIVTSACLTGADPLPLLAPAPPLAAVAAEKPAAEKPPEKVPAPLPGAPVVAPLPAPGSCGSNSGSGSSCGCASSSGSCESHGLFSRFRSGRSKHGCDTCNTCAPAPVVVAAPCSTCDTCAKHGFFDRFKTHGSCNTCDACSSPGLFGRFRSKGCSSGCASGSGSGCASGCDSGCGSTVVQPVPVAKPGEPLKVMPKEGEPKKLPEGGKEAALPVAPVLTPAASKTVELGTKSPFDLSHRFEKRVDHAANYSQLTGQLFFVHADGGLWVLRYAPLGTEDRNGGGVILARDRSMDSYREGDLVTVRGEILQERASRHLGAPLYRTSSIQLVERGEK